MKLNRKPRNVLTGRTGATAEHVTTKEIEHSTQQGSNAFLKIKHFPAVEELKHNKKAGPERPVFRRVYYSNELGGGFSLL